MAASILVLFSLMVGASWAYPFPVVRRAAGFGPLRRNDLYGQETFADRSVYGVPATRSVGGVSRSAWPFLNDYVLNRAPAAPIPAGPVAYGVPGDAIWADALLRFDESAGRMAENKPQDVVAQLLRRQEPYAESARQFPANVDYGADEEEDYDGQVDFVPEITQELSPDIMSYANQYQASIPEDEAPMYDATLRVVPQQIPLAIAAPDEQSVRYRESILPYLLMSALENEESNLAARNIARPQIPNLPEMSQFGEIKAEVQAPEATSVNDQKPTLAIVNAAAMEMLDNAKRTKPSSERPSESVVPTQPPVVPSSTTTEATTTVKATSSPVKAVTPKSVFHRGQEEVAMLRPPSDNRRYSNRLSALSWPKELEEDDTEEQKRQLRELPSETVSSFDAVRSSADNMIPIAHSPRKWPAALDEVDDWLAGELNQLKSRPETER